MSEILKKRLKKSIGKNIKIFLKDNNFKFEGRITNCDDTYVEILDKRLQDFKVIEISKISDIDLLKGGERENENTTN